jgi:hypothetical protein
MRQRAAPMRAPNLPRAAWIGLGAAVLVASAIAFALTTRKPEPRLPPPIPAPSEASEGIARRVAEVLHAERARLALKPVPEARVYLALRKNGLRLAHGFVEGPDWPRAVLEGVEKLVADRPSAAEADTVELCLPHSRERVKLRKGKPPLGDKDRGVLGLELKRASGGTVSRCPTQLVADNVSFATMLKDFGKEHRLTEDTLLDEVTAEQYEAYQFLVRLDGKKLQPMFRGNEVVKLESVTAESTKQLAAGMTQWMKAQVQPDGRMVYMYFPSRGEEASAGKNNMIRQFMATLCLQRIANREQSEAARELAQRNLRFNLATFFRLDGDKGLIDERGKYKLGGIALAALSIIESPFRAEFAAQEAALRRTVESMQQPDGSFRTFYGLEQNDNQNFYPGEALLMWAILLAEKPDSALEDRFKRAFLYYRDWHRQNTNPAFIPWHTQAYYAVWKRTRDPELRDFMFEMNDFLSDFQQWDAPYDDLRGRFYDPDRRAFGPPHASSTGVYLEGLTDVRMLARQVGDKERERRYSLVIKRALRSLMQLQFVNEIDTFYISKKERVLGGVRTNEYDNAIRVDNVQHSLMGLQKLLDDIAAGNAL